MIAIADEANAEGRNAWQKYLHRLHTFCCDESGIELPLYQGGKAIQPPVLDPVTDYAIRQCGGHYGIEYCKPENLHFVRRDFLVAYSRFQQTDGLKRLPHQITDLPHEIQDEVRKALKPMEEKRA